MLDKYEDKILAVKSQIEKLEEKVKDTALKHEKHKNEIKNLVESLKKYKEENPVVYKQMKEILKTKLKEYDNIKIEIKGVRSKQLEVQQELKKLFAQIVSSSRVKKHTEDIVTAVYIENKKAKPEPEKPVQKTVVKKQEEIKAVPEQKPAAEKAAPVKKTEEVVIKKPVPQTSKSGDFHSKVAEEAESQAKYLSSLADKTRHYGSA